MEENIKDFESFAKRKTRNSAFELLRIIAMLMIIGHHFVVHGGFAMANQFNSFVLTFLEFGGKFGVIIYILISSYFLVNSKFSYKRLIKLWFEVWLYSIILYCISIFLPNYQFSWKGLLVALMPVLFIEYWFVTYYIFLYILSPFINRLIHSLTKNQFGSLIIISLFLYSILRFSSNTSSIFLMFIIIYMIGAYLRLYPIKAVQKYYILIPAFVVLYIALILLQYYLDYQFFEVDRILMLLSAVIFFMIFEKIKITSKTINLISASTFGAYLIHDNINISPYLWNNLFENNTFANSEYLLLYAFLVIATVFVVCAIIDIARKHFIEKPLFKQIDKQIEKYKIKKKIK